MIKKHQEVTGFVEKVLFPNVGIVDVCDNDDHIKVRVKDVLKGQRIRLYITRKKNERYEGRLIEVMEPSVAETVSDPCCHYPQCGGCLYQTVDYDTQLKWKQEQIEQLLAPVIGQDIYNSAYEGIARSPYTRGYRNKMELTFGDSKKGGQLALGMHKRGAFYDILSTTECRLMDEDMRNIQRLTLEYFKDKDIPYYHKRSHTGYLRHLLIRKAHTTGQILIDLVTSTQNASFNDRISEECLLKEWMNTILSSDYEGVITGVLHTVNDRLADIIEDQGTSILYGRDFFQEKLLGLTFNISPFSFFQTNSYGAEELYSLVRRWLKDEASRAGVEAFDRVFDLYSGTGTISQIISESVREATGVEIVSEAVEAAKSNASYNGISNCSFIAGDVLKVLDDMTEPPDCIILDPPREGINPKALTKIINYGTDYIIYISCKATSLARELPTFMEHGYLVRRIAMVDLFPFTTGVETVCLLSQRKPDTTIEVDLDISELEVSSAETKATYEEIKSYVLEKFGLKVSNLYIAQVKRECGIVERINYNLPKTEGNRVPQCPEDKRKAIKDAFIHFQMI